MRYVGIDVAVRRFDVAVIDRDRRIHALPAPFPNTDGVVAWVRRYAADSHVAIDAPQRTREGVLGLEEYRRLLAVPPPPGRYLTTRECDYELWLCRGRCESVTARVRGQSDRPTTQKNPVELTASRPAAIPAPRQGVREKFGRSTLQPVGLSIQ